MFKMQFKIKHKIVRTEFEPGTLKFPFRISTQSFATQTWHYHQGEDKTGRELFSFTQ